MPPFAPGMLSAALQAAAVAAAAAPQSAGGGPPTPPRTPKTPHAVAAASDLLGQSPKSAAAELKQPPAAHLNPPPPPPPGQTHAAPNPLLSLAAIQEQVGKAVGPPVTAATQHHQAAAGGSANILAAHLAKPMVLPGMMGGGPGGSGAPAPPPIPGIGPPPPGVIPPHILAAQRAGIIPGGPKLTTDYTRYFKRFSSAADCGSLYCKDMNYREHFHCTVPMCKEKFFPSRKVFAKKEEMIRHSKWHQKMDEAFKYGFRRVTPSDDCTDQFPGCQHNRKQTHYHCIQSKHCDKCYISTSDVQMHFNYHRKDNAIQREGFLR